MATSVFISEFHYDNTGTDVGEFIEIAGPAGTDLSGWSLVLYNGNGGTVYNTVALSGVIADQSNGHGTVVVDFPSNGIQNGAPDGLALVDGLGNVVEFLSYEGSFTAVGGAADGLTSVDIGVAETGDTAVGQSLQRIDGVWTGPLAATKGAINSGDGGGGDDGGELEPTAIYTIQGAGHSSALVGQTVLTTGIVTAVDSNGFYLQDAVGDGNIATSDAIFVFTGSAPTVAVGDGLEVTGTVSEFTPGGVSTRNLSTTQISGNPTITTLSSGNALPEAVILGAGGRVPPTENIDDDAFGSFDPVTDGIDFFESLEGMRVTAQDVLVVNGTNGFGEIFGVVDNGAGATGLSTRGTLNISPDDFNPERVQIQFDSGVFDFAFPAVNVGDNLGDVTGVVNYDFGNFQIVATEDFTSGIQSAGLQPEVSTLTKGSDQLTVASYNVLNLDPNDGDGDTDMADGRFDAIAQQIVNNLNAPDIIALQEIQDNNGSLNDGVTAADVTLQTLVDAIAAAGGPTYAFIDNTFITDDASGGQPGANIRTAYLYDPSRVNLVEGSVATIGGQSSGEAFAGARLPLVASFEFNGETVTLINNHFSSKGGSAPILGTEQPFEDLQEDPSVNGSLDERQAQSEAVQGYVSGLLGSDPAANVVVLGDLNEFEFVSPLTGLESAGLTNLTNTLPENERYSFIFQGNSQSLDHILVSESLSAGADFDAVHVNAEFAESPQSASDHDPLLARFTIEAPSVITGTPGRDVLVGSDRSDTILASGGPDLVTTGGGRDRIVYTSTAQTGATITDFAVGADQMVFTDLLASVGYGGTDPIADGVVQIRNLGNSGRAQLSLELEGGAGRSQFTNFITFQGVDAAALNNAENFVF
ncbi:endonuclease/exonuclease/phosphatase family protein [Nodosilinea sp. AN01ver1]|uniref:endonuclease/exonuclease/phosphatase family protein n=1 Tax=Nodosilinea sp. AN01ver1 TaxID=3423362 RepID=UPI003D314971